MNVMGNFREYINSQFVEKYINSLDEDFDAMLNDLNLEMKEIQSETQREEKMINVRRRCSDTKKRWVKELITGKNREKIDNELMLVNSEYSKVMAGDKTLDEFRGYFGVNSPKEYKDRIIKEVEDWKNDSKSMLSDFPYQHLIAKRSLRPAYKNDVLMMFYDYICNYKDNNQLTKVPTIFSNILVDTTNRATLYSSEELKRLEKSKDINIINPFEREVMAEPEAIDKVILELEQKSYLELKRGNSLEAINFATELALIKALRYMNSLDVALCVYYYNFRNILNDEEIVTSIYAVAEDMGLPHSERVHNELIDSHIKLSSSNLKGTITGIGDEKFSINGALLECAIYEENKIKMVRVKLGGLLKEMVMKKSAFEYNKELYNSYSKDAKQISTWLQMRRYRAYINNESLETSCNLATTTFGIYWRGNRITRKRKRVEDALEEMKAQNHIVRDYSYNKKTQTLTIYFQPLDGSDLHILNSNGVSLKELPK